MSIVKYVSRKFDQRISQSVKDLCVIITRMIC